MNEWLKCTAFFATMLVTAVFGTLNTVCGVFLVLASSYLWGAATITSGIMLGKLAVKCGQNVMKIATNQLKPF